MDTSSNSTGDSSTVSAAVNQKVDSPPLLHQGNPFQSQPLDCKWTHDVFPSFRGEDVRRTFLSHILKELCGKGITPFIDNEIKRGKFIGPELIQAIRRSKVGVVLLSRNYASSKWCLDELAEIMKSKKELGQTVVVIFYEVDPSEVKKLTGDFGVVFEKTCAGKKKEDVMRWTQAFAEVATIAGYDSRNWDNEAEMIEVIVTEIFKRLFNSTPTKYFQDLIGMGAHMEAMKWLLCLGSNEVRIIGIWGPPGIGKTSIARVTYDQVSNGFQLKVFMKMKPSYAKPTCSDDYDEKLYLEQQFLSQLTNQKDLKISHLGAAQEFLMGKKVLVIFDGVEQLMQLLAMPEAQYFGHGSRIIVTTQNLRLLNAFQIKHIYHVDLPPNDEALQIFCMSAFGQSFPKDGFKTLAWQVTRLVGRLPLGLKVMGSHFRGILSKQEWKTEIPRLRVRLDKKIESILKLSYDALQEEDRDLFLYIACFFIDERSLDDGTFEDVLKHKFSNVRQGLEVLVERSLVSTDSQNYYSMHDKDRFSNNTQVPQVLVKRSLVFMDCQKYYSMHDLLVQLGREIICNKSIYERHLLVEAKEICEVLNANTERKNVIGINFDNSSIHDNIFMNERAFEDVSNLQLLRFHTNERLIFPQGLKYLPSQLRVLDWLHYPMKSLPSSFNPKFLVKIQLKYNKLKKLWEGIQPLENLKFMDLSFSTNLKKLPNLSTAVNLFFLNLSSCSSIVKFPSSIGNLTNLIYLDLSGCSNPKELLSCFGNIGMKLRRFSNGLKLPTSIGNLTNLKKLDLSKCLNLVELPSSFGNLTNLHKLYLNGCSNLVELSSSFGNLTNLQHLDLRECSNLVKFPSSFGNLTNLHKLYLSGCSNLVELSYSFGNLTNIQDLELKECSNLVELPSSIGNLTNLHKLYLGGCSNLVELPSSFGNLTNLQDVELIECSNLVELPSSIGNLTNLQKVNLRGKSKLVELPSSFGNLINLHTLYLNGCSNLVELSSSFGDLTNLRDLELIECSNLVELSSSLGNLTNLRKLKLIRYSNLVELPSSFGNLTNLETLYLGRCSNLMELPSSFGDFTYLQDLELIECSNLVGLSSSFGNLTNLQKLNLIGCSNLIELPSSFGNLTNLHILYLGGCSNLVELPSSFGNLTNLHTLYLGGCSNLVELPSSFGNLTKLPDLDLRECSNLAKLPSSIGNLTNLQELNLSGCLSLVKIPSSVGNLQMLKRLDLEKCSKLEVLPININLGSLEFLYATDCSQLRSFPEISTNIKVLRLCGTLIEEIPLSLKSWPRLQTLEIPYCKNLGTFWNVLETIEVLELKNTEIEEFPPWVNGCSSLRKLVLNSCMKLTSIPQLPDFLRTLFVENCELLERLPSSFSDPHITFSFVNCWKLNEEARDIILQKSLFYNSAMLPGREVPELFTYRSISGGSVKANLGGNSKRLRACISLVCKGDKGARPDNKYRPVHCKIVDKQRGLDIVLDRHYIRPLVTNHLYTFKVQTNLKAGELFFEFELESDKWEIAQCGIRQL